MKAEWNTQKMSDVFYLQMGKTPSRDNNDYWGGSAVWVSVGDIGTSKYIFESKESITERAITETKIKEIPANCVIMSFKLSVGKVAITLKPLYTNEAIMAFIPKDGCNLLPDYIYYYLKWYKWENVNRAAMGMTLNKASISQGFFSYPSFAEQERIVSELDLLSGIIDKQKAQLKELDNLAQSIFYDMFGDPVENEKGFGHKKIEEVCSVTSSTRIFAYEYSESGIPFYRGKEVSELSRGESISSELYISLERYSQLLDDNNVPCLNDILITAVGTIGNIWVVNTSKPFYFKDGNIIWLRNINFSKLNSSYFRFSLYKMIAYEKENMSIGSAYKALTIQNLKKMNILIPSLVLQEKFAEKIERIEKQKEAITRSIADTQQLFDYTMDKYFG